MENYLTNNYSVVNRPQELFTAVKTKFIKKNNKAEELFEDLVRIFKNSHEEDIDLEEARKLAQNFVLGCRRWIELKC